MESNAWDVGLIGLGVMGANLAQNIESRGYSVAVWNRELGITEAFMIEQAGRQFRATETYEEFVGTLAKPRRIIMMVTAGKPVDMVLESLAPYLDKGDIVVDGGNSRFEETARREGWCQERGFRFVGMGVSGGEDGARLGPSLMPGGDADAYRRLQPVLEAIAAQSDSGPCVTHVGPGGAGHFVKMVHNGIEYGDMQLLAESYDLLQRVGGLSHQDLIDTFDSWNEGPLGSFLVEITAKIFRVKAEDGSPLLEKVLDRARQKGTGRWTVEAALELGVSIPTISAAVDARTLSSMKAERVYAARVLNGPPMTPLDGTERDTFVAAVHDALLASKVCAYAQGLALIEKASEAFAWNIDLQEVARIWKAGCIIRAKLLDSIRAAYAQKTPPKNLVLDPRMQETLVACDAAWRKVVGMAAQAGVPVPAFSGSLNWFDAYRTERLPQNLTQAQRDAFGAHTYVRLDGSWEEPVHTDWI